MYQSPCSFLTMPHCAPPMGVDAEAAARFVRWIARPLLVGLTIGLLIVALMFTMRVSMPLISTTGVVSPHFMRDSIDRQQREQALQAEVNAYLAALNATDHRESPAAIP